MLEPEEAAALFILALLTDEENSERKRPKKVWVQPSLRDRNAGAFAQLYPQLLDDEEKFFDYFRMTQSSFEELHSAIEVRIRKENTFMRDAIPTKERLAIALRYLASGCTLTHLHRSYKCGVSTTSKLVEEVCEAIWGLSVDFLAVPSEDEWLTIASEFDSTANFPHCLGAIIGKRVKMMKVKPNGRGRHKHLSFVVLAICDSNYLFRAIDVDQSESGIFPNSNTWKRISSNTFNIPKANPIVSGGCHVDYVFVGDEAFGLSKHVMIPFAGRTTTTRKKTFNSRLVRVRRSAECAFSILANKWQIFQRPLNVEARFAENIVKACVVLHNFVRQRDGIIFEESLHIPPTLEALEKGTCVIDKMFGLRHSRDTRNHLADYFAGPEQLDVV